MSDNPLHVESYREALVFFATAGVVVPLFHRLRVSPVLGFLLAGVALGPHGLGRLASTNEIFSFFTITDVAGVSQFAEFGLVFLLFMIGLELSWERLVRMRRFVFGLGLAQVAISTAVLAVVGRYWFGVDPAPAILMGAALAMSSTAVVMPVLSEARRVNKTPGRVAFSVLLLQDLMVAPALFYVSFLARSKEGGFSAVEAATAFLPALIALAGLIVFGRLLLRPLFRLVASVQLTELFMAACLLVVVGEALVTAAAGLSMGLGAFIGGLLLAETEFRREIEVTIEPFKGLLLGLFFVSVGAGLDIGALAADPVPVFLNAAGLIAVKAAIIFPLALLFGVPWRMGLEAALLLAPGGEFAFALLTSAMLAGVLPGHFGADAMVVVTLTIFAIPLLGRLGAGLSRRAEREEDEEAQYAHLAPPESAIAGGRVVIVGFGRIGSLVGEMLERHDVPFVAIENLVSLVTAGREKGVEIYWGNAARRDFLLKCGLEQARALVVTIENAAAVEEIVRLAHEIREDLIIVARARDARHATALYALGASDAIPETIEASLQLAETVLVDVGVPMGYVIASIHEKRDEFRKILQPTGEEARARQKERRSRIKREQARRRISGRPAGEGADEA